MESDSWISWPLGVWLFFGPSCAEWSGTVNWSCGKEAVQVRILLFFSMGLFSLFGGCFLCLVGVFWAGLELQAVSWVMFSVCSDLLPSGDFELSLTFEVSLRERILFKFSQQT